MTAGSIGLWLVMFRSHAGVGGRDDIQNPVLSASGYQGVITQAGFGVCANLLGEFAPDIMRALKKENKTGNTADGNKSAP